ncbi:MAG TPA: Ig-like domain-containing protein [Spirochaetota bacterium]|nr:Ig-like domain-containing protein [Spirochaetota bacterium]
MRNFAELITGLVHLISRGTGKFSGLNRRMVMLFAAVVVSLTFCEDIMESVKEYNNIFEVMSVSPSRNAANVPVTSLISAKFSQGVDTSTLDGTTFIVNDGAADVTGTLSYNPSSQKIIFTPPADLLYGATYTVEITTGLRDDKGTYLPSAYTWSFTTEQFFFNLISIYPAGGAIDVPVNTEVIAQFDDNIDFATVNATTFAVSDGAAVAGTYAIDGTLRIVTFTPSAVLNGTTLHTVTLTTGILNTGGESMASNYSWNFTTSAAGVPEIYIISPLSTDFISGDTFDLGGVTTPYTFTIGNSGNVALNITLVTLSDSTNFATSLAPSAIGGGTNTTFTVTFTPASTGVKNAVLSIGNDDSDENPFIINLTADTPVLPAPEIQITWDGVVFSNNTSTVDFGTLTIGATDTQTIVIHNIGTADLHITGTTIGGTSPAYFSTGFSTATIASGGTANVAIQFSAPIKVNAKATITFDNDDSDEGPFMVKLKGRTMP